MRAKAIWGGESPSTNNRMEIMGLLEGLRALERPTSVHAHVDSTYLMKAFTDRWLDGWQRRGWVNSQKKPVANRDLWERLLRAMAPHEVTWKWVRGHSGDVENERCDVLAETAARQWMSALGDEIVPREQQTPDALGILHRSEIKKWWPIIKAANIKAE